MLLFGTFKGSLTYYVSQGGGGRMGFQNAYASVNISLYLIPKMGPGGRGFRMAEN